MFALVLLAAVGVPSVAGAANPASLLVVPTQYSTIQAAVDAAKPGDTVVVRPGTYNEQISIGKNLTVRGPGATIHAPAVLTFGYRDQPDIIEIRTGASVKITGLTVSGPGPNSCGAGSLRAGIKVVEGAMLDLSSARVLDIQDTPIHDCRHRGSAIEIGDFIGEQVGHARIHDVSIHGYQSNAIEVFTPGSDATITGNVMDAAVSPSAVVWTGGIELGTAAVAKVTGNVIRGNRCKGAELGCGADPVTQAQGTGVGGNGPGAPPGPGTEFAHNVIANNDIGIYLLGVDNCCNVHDNVLLNNQLFGIAIQDGRSDVSHDVIVGGNVGVGVIADAVDTVGTLHHEFIAGTFVAPTRAIECCGFTATIEIA